MQPTSVTVETPESGTLPPGVVLVRITGDVGISSMVGSDGKHTGVAEDNALTAALMPVLATKPRLVIADLSQMTYLSSLGIGALLRFSNELQEAGGKLRLAGVQPMVITLLRRCHLDKAFEMTPDVDSALS